MRWPVKSINTTDGLRFETLPFFYHYKKIGRPLNYYNDKRILSDF